MTNIGGNRLIFKEILLKIKWTIISSFDYLKFRKELKNILKLNEECYVVFGHEADQSGGAPVVLYDLVRSIKQDNKCIIFLYKRGGELIKKGRSEGIYSYVYYAHLERYVKKLSKVPISKTIVNTVVCGECINSMQRITCKPIIWWIHEVGGLVDRFSYTFPKKLKSNVYIKGVSKESCLSIGKYYNDSKIDIMHYGCNDIYQNNIKTYEVNSEKYKIIVIGQICERKNQLQVFRAYELLPENLKEIINITFIAATWNSLYKEKFDNEIKKYSNMNFINGIERDEIYKVYLDSDLLLCTSIEDPLPVVVTEAMMLECPILISSGCGQYKYITNGLNGFTYDCESDSSLARAIQLAYEQRKNQEIRKNGRKVFLENFSLKSAKDEIYNIES